MNPSSGMSWLTTMRAGEKQALGVFIWGTDSWMDQQLPAVGLNTITPENATLATEAGGSIQPA